jgi:glycerophosphoryl diester phosphodiesterase
MARPNTLIVAGATGYGIWPANSLEGARRCIAAPIDGIEIDVQMTADGQVVAHHDYWLSPDATRLDGEWLSERSAPLKTMPLVALRRYDIGRPHPGSASDLQHPHLDAIDGARIPTLPDLLDALRAAPGPRRLIYVEIKTHPTRPDDAPAPAVVTDAVLDALEAADYVASAKIIAFDWSVLRLATARIPEIATAHLTIPRRPDYVDPGRDSPWFDGADPRHFGGSELAAIKAHGGMEWSPYYTDVTAERVAEADALGLKTGPWGLSKSVDIQRMIAQGVFSATVSGPDWVKV